MTDSIQTTILESAKKALVDRSVISNDKYQPKLIYNNTSAGHIVLSSIQDELDDCESFCISVAFVNSGGICCLFNDLEKMKERGIPGKIITTNYLYFNKPKALRQLREFTNIQIRMYEGDLHTKGYIFHKKGYDTVLVGSSNMTDSALKCNQEWNIRLSSVNQGDIVRDYTNEFDRLWSDSVDLTDEWIDEYEIEYDKRQIERKLTPGYDRKIIKPTKMQSVALEKIREMREQSGYNPEMKRALLISATGTGKTYISAFDVRDANPKKLLFMVHRGKILNDAMDSYKNVLGESNRTYGLYKGSTKDKDVDCLFASVNTLTNHLNDFKPGEFDYIVCDEAHHIVTQGQRRIIDYFKPKFMLGMTATPERTGEGNENVYNTFNYNIPFEIRLSGALEEKLVCPFHYFGIADLFVDGKKREVSDFSKISFDERVKKIIEEIDKHPYSGDRIRGLIFCSGRDEAAKLEKALTPHYIVKALTGENSEEEREEYFTKLQSDKRELDFIISVDILNEGIDLPRVNMIVMLRPTKSSIIFIQQLGRGLRLRDDKEFVTVLDFIGNYDNNYNIPIALFGDNTRRKENLRRHMILGNKTIPGASTVSFDEISKERIFKSIGSDRMNGKTEMKEAYRICANKIGHEPSLTDLYKEKSLDPRSIITMYDSLNDFRGIIKSGSFIELNEESSNLVSQVSKISTNGLRPHELFILRSLIDKGCADAGDLAKMINDKYGLTVSAESILDSTTVLGDSLKYVTTTLCHNEGNKIIISDDFSRMLENPDVRNYIDDAVECGILIFDSEYSKAIDEDGFALYKLYSRLDYCRIMNITKNNVNVIYGYKIMGDLCPLFVTYKKVEGVDQMYNDHFIDNKRFYWESRYPKNISSDEMQPILKSNQNGLKIHLFVQKDGADGTDFYYCGKVHFIEGSEKNSKTKDPKGNIRPVVSMEFALDTPVADDIYYYLSK